MVLFSHATQWAFGSRGVSSAFLLFLMLLLMQALEPEAVQCSGSEQKLWSSPLPWSHGRSSQIAAQPVLTKWLRVS